MITPACSTPIEVSSAVRPRLISGRMLMACLLLLISFRPLMAREGEPVKGQVCLAVADVWGTDQLVALNPAGGPPEVILQDLEVHHIEALAIHPGSGQVWGVNHSRLGRLDLDLGRFIPAAEAPGIALGAQGPVKIGDTDGITFDPTGNRLYAVFARPHAADILYRLDTETGLVVKNAFGVGQDYLVLGGVTDWNVDDMAFHPGSGLLYLLVHLESAPDVQLVAAVSPLSGEISRIVPLQTAGIPLRGMAFREDGSLLATPKPAADSVVFAWTLDLATGTLQQEGLLGTNIAYEACACPGMPMRQVRGQVTVPRQSQVSRQLLVRITAAGPDAGVVAAGETYTLTDGRFEIFTRQEGALRAEIVDPLGALTGSAWVEDGLLTEIVLVSVHAREAQWGRLAGMMPHPLWGRGVVRLRTLAHQQLDSQMVSWPEAVDVFARQ
ncbi:MAG: hypothetical protein SF053_08605 [Bacteroidia bacterium]|nr:hypothetical protein [Bacteroidia bacterium]